MRKLKPSERRAVSEALDAAGLLAALAAITLLVWL